jgi:hypothetical protein
MRKLKNKTATNKIYASMLLGVSTLSIFIDGDITGLVMGLAMSIPLFFAKENVII